METEKKEVATWTIKKEISLGDLIAFVMAFVSLVYAYTTLDKRLSIVEDRQAQQEAVDVRQDSESGAVNSELKHAIEKLETKIDRLIEKGK
jgi:uncharacterized protein (UPF0218 family)